MICFCDDSLRLCVCLRTKLIRYSARYSASKFIKLMFPNGIKFDKDIHIKFEKPMLSYSIQSYLTTKVT